MVKSSEWPHQNVSIYFYRHYHGVCFDEIKSTIPPKASFARNTLFSKIQHPYAKLDTNRTNAFVNSFIPMTSKDWNSLPISVFPATFSISSTDTFNSDPIPKISSYFLDTRVHSGCIFLVHLLLVSISLYKKKNGLCKTRGCLDTSNMHPLSLFQSN